MPGAVRLTQEAAETEPDLTKNLPLGFLVRLCPPAAASLVVVAHPRRPPCAVHACSP